ncbi:MAG: hypothetical protein J0L66_16180 [Cytophagales bacterium]|nr:hypothetical protein [Cytophagales bacterium]
MAARGLSNISVQARMKQFLLLLALVMISVLVAMVSSDGKTVLSKDSLKTNVRSASH